MTTNTGIPMAINPRLALIYLCMQHIENKDVWETSPSPSYHNSVIRSKQYYKGNKFVPRKDYKVKGVGNLMGNARTKKRI